jgi:hypothetical protein
MKLIGIGVSVMKLDEYEITFESIFDQPKTKAPAKRAVKKPVLRKR